jgi:hypothetical protein
MADYATLAQVKAALSDNSVSSNPYPDKGDTNLSRIITAASKSIDSKVSLTRKRTFAASADTTLKFHALGDVIGTVLFTANDIAQTPTTVTHNNGATTVVVDTNYMLLSKDTPNAAPYTKLQLIDGTSWTYTGNPVNAISITARFAYSVTPPDDIVNATIQLIIAWYRQRNTVANIQSAMVSTDGTLVFPDGFPKSVADMLEPYAV